MTEVAAPVPSTHQEAGARVRLEPSSPSDRKLQLLEFGFAAGAVGTSFVMAGLGGPFNGPVLCPLRAVTGIPCPFCGMTHSFVHFAAGRFGESFTWSPLGPLLFALFAIAAVALAVLIVRRQVLVLPSLGRLRWLVVGTPLFALWVYQLFNLGPLRA